MKENNLLDLSILVFAKKDCNLENLDSKSLARVVRYEPKKILKLNTAQLTEEIELSALEGIDDDYLEENYNWVKDIVKFIFKDPLKTEKVIKAALSVLPGGINTLSEAEFEEYIEFALEKLKSKKGNPYTDLVWTLRELDEKFILSTKSIEHILKFILNGDTNNDYRTNIISIIMEHVKSFSVFEDPCIKLLLELN